MRCAQPVSPGCQDTIAEILRPQTARPQDDKFHYGELHRAGRPIVRTDGPEGPPLRRQTHDHTSGLGKLGSSVLDPYKRRTADRLGSFVAKSAPQERSGLGEQEPGEGRGAEGYKAREAAKAEWTRKASATVRKGGPGGSWRKAGARSRTQKKGEGRMGTWTHPAQRQRIARCRKNAVEQTRCWHRSQRC